MKQILAVASLVLAVAGCSSAPKTELEKAIANNVGEERVVARIDNLSSRPKWIQEATPFVVENSSVKALGQTVLPADQANVSAAYRISANNGKSLIAHSISQKLAFTFQNGEFGTQMGSSQAQFIGEESSRMTTSSIHLTKQYWERVAIVESSGQTTVQLRVFTLSEMPEADFKAATLKAIRENEGQHGIDRGFAKKLDESWSRFTEVSPALTQDDRKPSTAKSSADTE